MSDMKKNPVRKGYRRRHLYSAVAFLMLFFLGLSASVLVKGDVHAAPEMSIQFSSKDQIKKAQENKKETEKAIADAKSQIEMLRNETGEIQGELQKLNELNAAQRAQYLKIAEEYAAALIAKKEALDIYLEAQEVLEQKTAEYSMRISVMFELQNKSTLEILLGSESLAGFFTNMELIELIAQSDEQIMEGMQSALDEAELRSEYALLEAEEMERIAELKQADLIALEEMIGKTEATLKEREIELSTWEKKEAELEKESERLTKEIAQLQAELYSSGGGGTPPNGKYTWPYPGDYKIHSKFGMRYHPVYKVNKMHSGVDLGGVVGNPIVAAASGTVILVKTPVKDKDKGGSGYGNYLIIDHGGGISTLYGHCKSIYVSVGDKVVEGQKIASCGSTGTSTGAHLHFEVRVNGEAKDPALYIK